MGQELVELIVELIRREGPLTFARFMSLALYHPAYGYYTAGRVRIGQRGDYYTAPAVHPVFGAMLAEQLNEMWEIMGSPPCWKIVEYGAGTGWLAGDILESLRLHYGACFAATRYEIVEISPALRAAQERHLRERFGSRVTWAARPGRDGIEGCILANEMLDALPFHLVRQERDGRLSELYVGWDGRRLVEVAGPPSTPELEEYLAAQGVRLAPGQRAEVCLAALDWVAEASGMLKRGYVFIIDYGMDAADLYHPARAGGTLRCFRDHRLGHDPLTAVGEQDITAHVNFSALVDRARRMGLRVLGPVPQGRFLVRLLPLVGRKWNVAEDHRVRLALKELIFRMGDIFQVLVLCKGVPAVTPTGLRSEP